MAFMEPIVEQDGYTAVAEGAFRRFRVNPRGELVTPDWMTQLVLDGRVYNCSHSVQETGSLLGETGPGTANIAPSILVDVPSGTTIIPLELRLAQTGVGSAGDWDIVRMNTDDKLRYTSGGEEITPINMRKDDPNTSSCSVYNAGTPIVAIANTDDDTIWFDAIDTSAYVNKPLLWSAKTHVPPVLIGPSSLQVFVEVSNVDEGVFWSFKYAEFSTSDVT